MAQVIAFTSLAVVSALTSFLLFCTMGTCSAQPALHAAARLSSRNDMPQPEQKLT
jgi:hypothetical protein